MNDQILQGLLKHNTIRFAAITGQELVAEAQRIHTLSRTATAALGRELLMVAMMAGQLKNDTDSVSAILSGGGPGGNLVCVGRKGPFVKGCAGDPACDLILMDELGFLEADAPRFRASVLSVLTGPKPVLGVVRQGLGAWRDAPLGEIWTVSESNRDAVPARLREKLAESFPEIGEALL